MLIKSKFSGFLADGTRTPFLGGGSGFLGLGPKESAPPPPDYAGAAQATATGNLDAARAATAANRVNQVTPYGNLDYSITGQDPYGNPTWTAKTSLSPVGQQLLNTQNQTSLGLGSAINSQLGQVQDVMGRGFNPNTAPITTDPNYASGMEGWDKANSILQARLAPQLEQQSNAQAARLANAGIVQGTKAYDNAMRTFNQGRNDLITNSQLAGQQIGRDLFNQGIAGGNFANTAQQQQFNQALTRYNLPLNTLSALRTGAQVQNPTFVNSAQQATTSGPDLLGASQMGYNAQMGDFNARQAAQQSQNQGLMSLAGAGLMAFSDIRMKENIKQIHWLPNGLPVYEFEYKPEFKDIAGHGKFVGVMAHEAEQMYPQAVTTFNSGYKAVNYGLLP
jgi:hypothetical protein